MWFAGGGTGGHLFPALAVAAELRRRRPSMEIVFVGGHRGIEQRLVPEAGYPLKTLTMSGLKGTGLAARLSGVRRAGGAVLRCLSWVGADRPQLVVGVGGYASGPATFAARLRGVPTMVLEQNHFPGATNRLLARWAKIVAVPSEAARRRLKGIGEVTGNPVRPEFASIPSLTADGPASLLVFGGSRGARSINRGMIDALPRLAALPAPPSIVHQTGEADLEEVQAAYAQHYPADRAEVRPFLNDMAKRLTAASLVVCRAGATTLAELAVAGRPAVLIPFPHAADDHQRHNAESVAEAGAGVVVADRDAGGGRLADVIGELLPDRARLIQMGEAARGLGRPDALARIADLAETLLPPRDTGGADVS